MKRIVGGTTSARSFYTAASPNDIPGFKNLCAGFVPDVLERATQSFRPGLNSLTMAPPNFAVETKKAIFVDFLKSDVAIEFDVTQKRARAKVKVTFMQPEEGYPIIDLVPKIDVLRVNGKELNAQKFAEVRDPDKQSTLRTVQELLPKGEHSVEFEYDLGSSNLRFDAEGVNFSYDLSDLSVRTYSEKYVPANFEYDQYQTTMNISFKGAKKQHRIVANGEVSKNADDSYTIKFPEFYTTSSYFLHVFDAKAYTVLEDEYQGTGAKVPMTVYASSASSAASALKRAKLVLAEHEADFGPFGHEKVLIHVAGMGGMEYAGATRTSFSALGHELNHSWFARGVMPANGNAGWIDEAIASWRDNGYPRAAAVDMNLRYPPLASFSPYRRDTTQDAYGHGARVMSELDLLLRDQGGLRPVLREWYATYRYQPTTTEMFETFVQKHSTVSLRDFFKLKVYGGRGMSVLNLPWAKPAVIPPLQKRIIKSKTQVEQRAKPRP